MFTPCETGNKADVPPRDQHSRFFASRLVILASFARICVPPPDSLRLSSQSHDDRAWTRLPNWVLNADETLASLGLSRVNTATLARRAPEHFLNLVRVSVRVSASLLSRRPARFGCRFHSVPAAGDRVCRLQKALHYQPAGLFLARHPTCLPTCRHATLRAGRPSPAPSSAGQLSVRTDVLNAPSQLPSRSDHPAQLNRYFRRSRFALFFALGHFSPSLATTFRASSPLLPPVHRPLTPASTSFLAGPARRQPNQLPFRSLNPSRTNSQLSLLTDTSWLTRVAADETSLRSDSPQNAATLDRPAGRRL